MEENTTADVAGITDDTTAETAADTAENTAGGTTSCTMTAAAEKAVESIKKLLETTGNDDALKGKLLDALAALTEKKQVEAEDGEDSAEDDDDEDDEADENDDDDEVSSGSGFSEIFNDDAVAGMLVGLVAGAAVVGGGVLLHKMLND